MGLLVVNNRITSCSMKCKLSRTPCRLPVHVRNRPVTRRVATFAFGESDAGVAMTLEQAQDLLQVKSTDGFETIMSAKSKQLARAQGDGAKIFQVCCPSICHRFSFGVQMWIASV